MYARTFGAATQGVDGLIISVEVDSANGMPAFDIVGLPSTAVRESKERVRTAIKNSSLRMRAEKITINLAPASVKKESAGLDLPIAIGLLAAQGRLRPSVCEEFLFVAELSLEGLLRNVAGVLPIAVTARAEGFKKIIVAQENINEALLVEGLEVYAPRNLAELADFLDGESLTVYGAREVFSDEGRFYIADADAVVWEWDIYDEPKTEASRCFIEYKKLADGRILKTTDLGRGIPEYLDPQGFNAVEIY